MKLRNVLKAKKGFTLVELMVVVVILGILVGIAVPAYNAVTKNAEKKACHSNCAIMEKAATQYLANVGAETVSGIAVTTTNFDAAGEEIPVTSKEQFEVLLSEDYKKNIETPITFFDNGCQYVFVYNEGGRSISVYCHGGEHEHGNASGPYSK